MKGKIVKTDNSEEILQNIYVLHITHRKEGPVSIDYLTRDDNVSYTEHSTTDIKKIIITVED